MDKLGDTGDEGRPDGDKAQGKDQFRQDAPMHSQEDGPF